MTTTQKKEIVDNILELLIQLTEDGDNTVATATAPSVSPEKLEMLTISECTEVIQGLSAHTVRQLVKQDKIKYVRTDEGKRGKILVNKADLLDYFQK